MKQRHFVIVDSFGAHLRTGRDAGEALKSHRANLGARDVRAVFDLRVKADSSASAGAWTAFIGAPFTGPPTTRQPAVSPVTARERAARPVDPQNRTIARLHDRSARLHNMPVKRETAKTENSRRAVVAIN